MRMCEKEASKNNGGNHLSNPDICLLQNSIVMAGSCNAVVCAVGSNTLNEVELTDKKSLIIEEIETPLQIKLSKFGKQLTKYAYFVALIIFVCLMVYWIIKLMIQGQAIISDDALTTLIENFEVCVAILIVCVPEGLPLAVSVAMAFSTDRLKDDNLLIKNLDALEVCGMLSDVITGKTGVLTDANMKVLKFFSGETLQHADS